MCSELRPLKEFSTVAAPPSSNHGGATTPLKSSHIMKCVLSVANALAGLRVSALVGWVSGIANALTSGDIVKEVCCNAQKGCSDVWEVTLVRYKEKTVGTCV